VLDFKTGQPITRHFVKEISITQEVILQVELAVKKNGFRPHAEPIFRTYALPTGVEDNDNNNIEDDSLSDEEGSVPDALYYGEDQIEMKTLSQTRRNLFQE